MPVLREGPIGKIGSGLTEARLIVQPDKILQLKRRFEDRLSTIAKFLREEHDALSNVPAPGVDPCSETTVKFLAKNGQSAVRAAEGFVNELTNVVDQLDQIARAYQLVEEGNAGKFRKGPG